MRGFVTSVAHLVGQRRFPKRAQKAISLALIEAIDNAIFHAHRRRRGLPIRVELTLQAGEVVIVVTDRGKGFKSVVPNVPALFSLHGRGLFLIRKVMHRVVSQKKKHGHILRMVYHL